MYSFFGLFLSTRYKFVCISLRLGQDTLFIVNDSSRLLEFVGNGCPHLVDNVENIRFFHHNLIDQGHSPTASYQILQAVHKIEYIYIHAFSPFPITLTRPLMVGWLRRPTARIFFVVPALRRGEAYHLRSLRGQRLP